LPAEQRSLVAIEGEDHWMFYRWKIDPKIIHAINLSIWKWCSETIAIWARFEGRAFDYLRRHFVEERDQAARHSL